jgi:competence protein ComEC
VASVSWLPARSSSVLACWLASCLLILGWWQLYRRGVFGVSAVLLVLSVAAAGGAWGVARHGLFSSDELAWRLNDEPTPLVVEGMVTGAPRPMPGIRRDPFTGEPIRPASELTLRLRRIRDGRRWVPVAGQAAVMLDGPPPPVWPGSEVRLYGRGLRPAAAGNPGEYDFRREARDSRILSLIRCRSAECLQVLAEPAGWDPRVLLERLRRHGSKLLQAGMPRETAALADALLLGNREWLPREQTMPFLVTGTIHILAISGLHVGILAWVLFRLMRALPVSRSVALTSVALATGGYMLLVHAEVPVVRATVIVWLACAAAWLGRRPLGINSLAVVAMLVMIARPLDLFRTGTQLSFLSTAVLILLAAAMQRHRSPPDPIARLIEQSRHPAERRLRAAGRGLLASVTAGAAVWVVTAPLVALQYHVVSPIALLLNPLVAPLVAVAMGCGLSALLMGMLVPTLAAFPAAATGQVLALISRLTAWASSLPAAYAWVSGPATWWVTGWYAVLLTTVVAAFRGDLQAWWRRSLPCLVWGGVGLLAWGGAVISPWSHSGLEVTLASLGHGCGIVVRPPSGEVLLYDAGRLGAPAAARRAVEAVLRDQGLTHIDTLVLSHADADHFNGADELLERFTVGELVVSPAFLASPSVEVAALIQEVTRRRIPIRIVEAGDRLSWREGGIRVLHPARGAVETATDDNASSLVMEIEAADRRVLLTGDIDGDAVDAVIVRGVPLCDVMVAPHHGSRTSLPPRLAEAVEPKVVLVSGAATRGMGEVFAAYAATGRNDRPAAVLCTCGQAAIRLRMDASAIRVTRGTSLGWGPETVLEE